MCDEMEEERSGFVLVVRKGGFGLPTACPSCLPVYLYLRFAKTSFSLLYDVSNPDSDHIPYIEYGHCVPFNNEKGGVIKTLEQDGISDLDSKSQISNFPEWLSTKALICSWLAEATNYEFWVASDRRIVNTIYFFDLPRLLAKVLCQKQSQAVKRRLGITNLKSSEKEEEIYQNATLAYEALSLKLGDQSFFFEDRPTSVDSLFLGHALVVLHALPDTSVLRVNLLKYDNLVKYAKNLKRQFLDEDHPSTSFPRSSFDASTSTPRGKTSHWKFSGSKSKPKPKREKIEEEKTFKRRAKYFLGAQLVAVLVFLSLFGGANRAESHNGIEYELVYED